MHNRFKNLQSHIKEQNLGIRKLLYFYLGNQESNHFWNTSIIFAAENS